MKFSISFLLVSVSSVFVSAAENPLAFPSYEQKIVATFATPAEAQAAACAIAPLPDNARIAFSCRWDDTNPADTAKGEMMVRAGVKGNFYFVGNDNPYFTTGPAGLMAMGHAIGNHTIGHPHMMTISPNAAFYQIAANRIKLEKVVQRTVTSYVSPYGWQQVPIDPDQAKTVAAALVASGHFVSQDARMPWSGLSDRTWMWTNRFNADDKRPDRAKFITGFTAMLAAAQKNPDVPRVTLGTHAWCDAKGNAVQEACLKEFFHPEDAVQMNDWEYGAYRYQYFYGGIVKGAVSGCQVTFVVTRYAATFVGDAIPLSLSFTGKPVKVTQATGEDLICAPRGTWSLPQTAVKGLLPRVTESEGGTVTISPDEAKGCVTLKIINTTAETMSDVYLAAALPPKWSERRVTVSCAELKPGAVFEKTLPMGTIEHADYAYGTAYYPISADFVSAGRPQRIWASTQTARVEVPKTVPAKAAKVWGPAAATTLAEVDWAAISVPGTPLPDAANWKSPKAGENGIWSAVTSPIKIKLDHGGDRTLYDLIKKGEHARYVVYDFTTETAGTRVLRLNYNPRTRAPFVCVNGVKMPFTGDGQKIAVKKGANRLIVRADTVMGGYYTDTLHLAVAEGTR